MPRLEAVGDTARLEAAVGVPRESRAKGQACQHLAPAAAPALARMHAHAIKKTGGVPTLLEWDANFISFPETLAEANKAQKYLSPEH